MATRVRPDVRIPSALDSIVGVWLLISSFVIAYPPAANATYRNVLLGVAVAVLGGIRASGAYRDTWISWLNALIGLFIMACPWIFGFADMRPARWNDVVSGALITAFAAWSVFGDDRDRSSV